MIGEIRRHETGNHEEDRGECFCGVASGDQVASSGRVKPPEIAGLVRDSADTVKDEISALLSPQVHEKELDHEMKQLRLDLIDRQIRMNLPKRHCDQLAVAELAFAKTYPALRFVAWGKIAKSGCGLPGLSDLDEPVDTSKIPGYQLSTTAS